MHEFGFEGRESRGEQVPYEPPGVNELRPIGEGLLITPVDGDPPAPLGIYERDPSGDVTDTIPSGGSEVVRQILVETVGSERYQSLDEEMRFAVAAAAHEALHLDEPGLFDAARTLDDRLGHLSLVEPWLGTPRSALQSMIEQYESYGITPIQTTANAGGPERTAIGRLRWVYAMCRFRGVYFTLYCPDIVTYDIARQTETFMNAEMLTVDVVRGIWRNRHRRPLSEQRQ